MYQQRGGTPEDFVQVKDHKRDYIYENFSSPSMWLDVTSTWEAVVAGATKVTTTPLSPPAAECQVIYFLDHATKL